MSADPKASGSVMAKKSKEESKELHRNKPDDPESPENEANFAQAYRKVYLGLPFFIS